MARDGGMDGNSLPEKGMASSCSGIAALTGLYAAGLVAILVAGALSPDLFTIKTASLGTSNGITSASSDFIFDTSDYLASAPWHQSLSLSFRTNIPAALQNVIDGQEGDSLVATERMNITVYGSTQEMLSSGSCPSGCIKCPNGDESIGLTCSLLADAHSRTEEVTCEGGEEWCDWVPVYDIHFLKYTTYYWAVETTSDLDGLVGDTEIDHAWEHEFRVIFVSPWWTSFEMIWYYFWIGFTLLAMFAPRVGIFAIALTEGVRWAEWTRWQKWSGVLLVALFFFDNPFFAAEVQTTAACEFFLSYTVLSGLFIALLLMSWMDKLFILGRSSDNSGYEKEGLARGAMWFLATLIFVNYTLVMIELRFSHEGDPRHVHEYPKTYNPMEQFLAVLAFVFSGWMVALSCRVWWNGRARDLLVSGSPLPKFLVGISVVAVLILLPSIILELLSPRVRGGFSFCLVHGATNLYVISLALCTPPSKDIGDDPLGNGFDMRNGAGVGGAFSADIAAATPKPEDVEEFDPRVEGPIASGCWKGKARPKIADSSAWEDRTSASAL